MNDKSIEEYKQEFIAKRGGRAKLEVERNKEIALMRYRDGMTLQVIATKHGLSRQRVHAIVNTY